MRRIIVINSEAEEFPADVTRIVRVLAANGFNVSRLEAESIWYAWSTSMNAGWMILPKSDDEVFDIARRFFTVVDE